MHAVVMDATSAQKLVFGHDMLFDLPFKANCKENHKKHTEPSKPVLLEKIELTSRTPMR
jgi:hypothetical protein